MVAFKMESVAYSFPNSVYTLPHTLGKYLGSSISAEPF